MVVKFLVNCKSKSAEEISGGFVFRRPIFRRKLRIFKLSYSAEKCGRHISLFNIHIVAKFQKNERATLGRQQVRKNCTVPKKFKWWTPWDPIFSSGFVSYV